MAMPQREGTYKAVVKNHWLEESKAGTPVVVIQLELNRIFHTNDEGQSGWAKASELPAEIRAYIRPVKHDGTANPTGIEQLESALFWDATDGLAAFQLDDGDLTDGFIGTELQAVLKNDTYNGETKLKVQWLNPATADPTKSSQGQKADAATVQNFAAQFDGMIAASATKRSARPAPPAQAKDDDIPFD